MRRPRYDSKSFSYFFIGLAVGIVFAVVLRSIYHTANMPEARRLFPDTAPQYLVETGNPLDLAINGPGFFAFEDEKGNWMFSRDSQIEINNSGEFVSAYGHKMVVKGRPPVPGLVAKTNKKSDPKNIYIDSMNMAWEIQSASKTASPIHSIALYRFSSHKNYVWGGKHYWFGRPPGELPNSRSLQLGSEPQILQGYRLTPDPPSGEDSPYNVNGPYHDGPKNIKNETLIKTDRELDFGIDGDGFVAVNLALSFTNIVGAGGQEAIAFTRWLSLEENSEGIIERKYPARLVTVTVSIPKLQSMPATGKIPIPVANTPAKTERVMKNSVPLIKSIECLSAASNTNASVEPADGFIKPSIGVPIFDEDIFSNWGEHSYRIQVKDQDVKRSDLRSIELYRFANPQNLHYVQNGVYTANDLSGMPEAVPQNEVTAMLKQGYLNDVERLKP